mmetsp:Transcript_123536/g.224564  ORF Transcript_123536/g.224564 Transcript_123536/m.224564 type:complete len:213 (-) Transcript_123536:44-682(-)
MHPQAAFNELFYGQLSIPVNVEALEKSVDVMLSYRKLLELPHGHGILESALHLSRAERAIAIPVDISKKLAHFLDCLSATSVQAFHLVSFFILCKLKDLFNHDRSDNVEQGKVCTAEEWEEEEKEPWPAAIQADHSDDPWPALKSHNLRERQHRSAHISEPQTDFFSILRVQIVKLDADDLCDKNGRYEKNHHYQEESPNQSLQSSEQSLHE